ncbi:MAG TPA: DUF58 domain-containing protein [Allosphingosinicella sp.]|uniref:DUF58 domain-containing protein n=1 Tax=Allosphingosinicella sp. TaxID=2823234 RepID=UPI002F2A6D5F
MIYPARRSILIAAALAPISLAIGVAVPQYWFAGLALLLLLLLLCGVDALAAATADAVGAQWSGPRAIGVGEPFAIAVEVRAPVTGPPSIEVAIDNSPLLAGTDGHRRSVTMIEGIGDASFEFVPERRGQAELSQLWMRWRGPLGLVWRQKEALLAAHILITPDIRPVRQKSAQLLHRDAMHGMAAQLQVGEGSEFEALTEYKPGMDRRSIDWKQSARHTNLMAKEYRTERNNNIVLAIDAGRAMGDPIAGVPRVDRAISAGLLTAFVALKEGDRVSFFGFDSRPRVATNPVAGGRSFALLQQVAARIDYSSNETNYTLALSTLAARLQRRSLIIIFTDFPDTISAELMLAALKPLLSRHLVLFVSMHDEELEALASAEPTQPQDVVRSVTAAGLLRQRMLVLTRLRRLGAHVIETQHDTAGSAVMENYLRLKRRGSL